MTRKKIRDSLSGNEIEVVVSDAGKLFHIEGFSYDFINSVTPEELKAYRNTSPCSGLQHFPDPSKRNPTK